MHLTHYAECFIITSSNVSYAASTLFLENIWIAVPAIFFYKNTITQDQQLLGPRGNDRNCERSRKRIYIKPWHTFQSDCDLTGVVGELDHSNKTWTHAKYYKQCIGSDKVLLIFKTRNVSLFQYREQLYVANFETHEHRVTQKNRLFSRYTTALCIGDCLDD